jgi:hypothetical protein
LHRKAVAHGVRLREFSRVGSLPRNRTVEVTTPGEAETCVTNDFAPSITAIAALLIEINDTLIRD